MTLVMAIVLALLIVSVVMAVMFNGWSSPLIWVAWAFSVQYLLAPLIGR